MIQSKLVGVVSLFVASSLFAATEGGKAQIGYVDMQKALQTVEAGKSAKAKLEKEVAAKKAELSKQEETFKKDVEAFEKKAAILNDSAKQQKQVELQKRYVELQKQAADSQMNLQKQEQELTKPILTELKGIIEGMGKEKKYQLIVEKNEGAVLYAEDGADLTQLVIDKFNEKKKKK